MGVKYTMRVIRETYNAWKKLVLQYEEAGLHRQLSVPSMDILDVDSDHQAAANFLLSPQSTPLSTAEGADPIDVNVTLTEPAQAGADEEAAPEF